MNGYSRELYDGSMRPHTSGSVDSHTEGVHRHTDTGRHGCPAERHAGRTGRKHRGQKCTSTSTDGSSYYGTGEQISTDTHTRSGCSRYINKTHRQPWDTNRPPRGTNTEGNRRRTHTGQQHKYANIFPKVHICPARTLHRNLGPHTKTHTHKTRS